MKIHPDEPAFSYASEWGYRPGLTIRAEFSARFMAAILSNSDGLRVINSMAAGGDADKELAEVAICLADALISELNKTAPATDSGEK